MSRFQPKLPAHAVKTYQIAAPLSTHFRPATCAEVDCPNYLHGWRVQVEGLPPEMLRTARTSGRKFSELHVAEGENWLVYEAGQRCFRASQHRVRLDRPEIYVVRGGDWRGNPRGEMRQHTSADSWLDDFATHQQSLANAQG